MMSTNTLPRPYGLYIIKLYFFRRTALAAAPNVRRWRPRASPATAAAAAAPAPAQAPAPPAGRRGRSRAPLGRPAPADPAGAPPPPTIDIHATWGPPFVPATAATPASAAAAEGVLQRQFRLIKLLNPYHQKSAPQLGCETSYIQVRDYADQPINQ